MSQFRDNAWLSSRRSRSVLKSLRRSRSKSSVNANGNTKKDVETMSQMSSSTSISMSMSISQGFDPSTMQVQSQNGFDELRRYVKQGGDFSKELILVLQERAETELIYSKSLTKIATKLNKACRELPGTVADAWRGVATEMENRSDIHRQLSMSLTEDIVKPLKSVVENLHKARKLVESNVDKASRTLHEWRISEAKGKKASHAAARENEKLQDAMLDVRIQKSPSISLLHQGQNKLAAEKELKLAEKDYAKLDNKRKKAEETVKRADVEYYTLCIRAERARVDWEMAVLRGSSQLQCSENQRLLNMSNFVKQYIRLTEHMQPIEVRLVQELQPAEDACDVAKDMQVVKQIRQNSESLSEQLLPDFYCEHTTLAMNRERRKQALVKLLQLVKADLERERRSRDGLKGISQTLSSDEQHNIIDKLYHVRSMLTYLEGTRLKLHSALLELDHKPRTAHPLAQHIQITRDRTGLQQSILKVPSWLKNNSKADSRQADERVLCTDIIQQINNNNKNDEEPSQKNRNFNRSRSHAEISAKINEAKQLSNATTDVKRVSDRGQADGGSNQQDSDFDEFSSQEDEIENQIENDLNSPQSSSLTNTTKYSNNSNNNNNTTELLPAIKQAALNKVLNSTASTSGQSSKDTSSSSGSTHAIGRCRALYSYAPKLYDELQLNPGDIIDIHIKQADGWWLGELANQIGIFPATYVEEF